MRARTFKNQFEPAITRKVNPKRQTVRPLPKRIPKAGDLESWRVWTGRPYSSPQRELVKVRLTDVSRITITACSVVLQDAPVWDREHFDWTRKGYYWLTNFSKADGFSGWEQMRDWFQKTHGFPFIGILIEAEDL